MSTIQDINIAVGLKEALLKAGITLEKIIDCGAEEIAITLGIDKYVATLILLVVFNTTNLHLIRCVFLSLSPDRSRN